MSPANTQTLTDEAWTLVESGRLREALVIFKRVIELNEAEAEAWMMCGSIHGDLGETQLAFACLERAIALAPDYADAYLHLGNCGIRARVCARRKRAS